MILVWEGLWYNSLFNPTMRNHYPAATRSSWRQFWCLGDSVLWWKDILMAWLLAWGRVITGVVRGRYRGWGLREKIKTAGDGVKNSLLARQALQWRYLKTHDVPQLQWHSVFPQPKGIWVLSWRESLTYPLCLSS